MRHDPEMSPFLRHPHLARWGLRDAALIQLCLAALTWGLVALIIRWSLDW